MDETVSFEGYPDVKCSEIVAIIEGYVSPENLTPVILVVLRNGAVLVLAVNDRNVTAVSNWRSWKRKFGYSG